MKRAAKPVVWREDYERACRRLEEMRDYVGAAQSIAEAAQRRIALSSEAQKCVETICAADFGPPPQWLTSNISYRSAGWMGRA